MAQTLGNFWTLESMATVVTTYSSGTLDTKIRPRNRPTRRSSHALL